MASSPLYGDRSGLQGFRRSSSSFTAPHRQLSHHERAGLDQSDADADVLYKHPSARIISFSPPTDSIVSKSRDTHADADYPIDTIETLPWRSRTENLLASGPLVIEKVKGSVNFLKCHQVVHSILRNSQCWCVDGESKFVLRKGKLQYYRIELPNTSAEDKAKVEELKQVFGRLLKFEKTPCPFMRAFHVDLPDDAITPRRKGKWTKRESLPATPGSSTPPLRRTKNFRSWSMQGGLVEHTNGHSPLQRESSYNMDPSHVSSPLAGPNRLSTRPDTPLSMASIETVGHAVADEGYDSDSSTDEADQSYNKTLSIDEPSSQSTAEFEEDIKVEPDSPLHRDLKPIFTEDAGAKSEAQEGALHEGVDTGPSSETFGEDMMQSSSDTSLFTKLMEDVTREVRSEGDTNGLTLRVSPESDAAAQDASRELNVLPDVSTHADEIPHVLAPASEETENTTTPVLPEVHIDKPSPVVIVPVNDTADDNESVVSAADSFYTVDSVDQEMDPSTLHTTDDLDISLLAESHDTLAARQYQHRRDISEITVTADSFDSSDQPNQTDRLVASAQLNGHSMTPGLTHSSGSVESWPDVHTPSAQIQDGIRKRLVPQRSLSPPPPPDTVFSPPRQNYGNHLTADLLQKATRLALVKPIEVVVLVVHILARIAGGASLNDLLSGNLFKKPEQHRRTSSFPDRLGSRQDDDDEDDFGVPIRGRTTSTRTPGSDSVEHGRDTDADSMFDLD